MCSRISNVLSPSGTLKGRDISMEDTSLRPQKLALAGAGGRIRVQVKAKELGVKDRLADLELIIWGDNLHAPLVERIVELPMDIYGGEYHLSMKNICLLSARSLPAHALIAMAPGKESTQGSLHASGSIG